MYYVMELSEVIKIATIRDSKIRYEYMYNLLCDKLEVDVNKYNYCLFEDDKCIAQRDNAEWPKNEYNGCCFDVRNKKTCDYLNQKECSIQCISCRLFTCRYLKDRGVDYNIRKNIIVRSFLNVLQTPELVWNFFTPKEKILNNVCRYRIKK